MVNLHEFVSIAILFVYFRTRKQTMEASTKLQLSTNLGNQTQPLPLTSKVKYPIADTTIRNHIISLSPNINTKNHLARWLFWSWKCLYLCSKFCLFSVHLSIIFFKTLSMKRDIYSCDAGCWISFSLISETSLLRSL